MTAQRHNARSSSQDPLSSLVAMHLARPQGVVRIDLPPDTTFRIPASMGPCLHVVAHGEVWLRCNSSVSSLGVGESAIVGRGLATSVSTTATGTPEPPWELPSTLEGRASIRGVHHLEAPDPVATMVCVPILPAGGQRTPFLDMLPDVLIQDSQPAVLQPIAQMLAAACARQGAGDVALSGVLAEVALLRTLQHHFATERPGMLGLLHDPRLANAIAALHADLARPWTVQELAALAGMSGSLFRSRLRAAVGEPWRSYVQRVRIRRAEQLLARPDAAVAQVAAAVGYQSESSFSRAFLQLSGTRPGQFIVQHGSVNGG